MLCFFGDGSGKHDVLFFFSFERELCFFVSLKRELCFFFFCFGFFFFFFFFLRFRFKGTARSGSITVLRTVRLNRGSNGSLHFWHRPVLEHKRTVMVRGSRFFRSDRTVRSGFQNLVKDMTLTENSYFLLLYSRIHPRHSICFKHLSNGLN